MRLSNLPKEQLHQYFSKLDMHISSYGKPLWIKYLDLGVKIVRLINYSPEFTSHVEKQLTYVLKETSASYDTTLIIWKETDLDSIPAILDDNFNPKINLRFRVEMLTRKNKMVQVQIKDGVNCIFSTNTKNGILSAYNQDTSTYYYAAENLEAEEFIKQGHIFVQTFNKILKTPKTGLVHGAVVGLENKGVLFCARGQRGKSTLAVLAMMEGFDYVSDDYLTLENAKDGLYAHPIYSIITLSPRMYNELYDNLDAKFISNNARKDKYVFNIESYHDRFKKRYPINICMFPEITNDKEPSIVPCDKAERGRAITQLIHSTIKQTGDKNDISTVKKLMDFVKDFEYYRINLCPDIYANVRVLREFMQKIKERENELCIK